MRRENHPHEFVRDIFSHCIVRMAEGALGEPDGCLVAAERGDTVRALSMDAIITFDATRRIELFNDAAEKVFCCPVTAALGQSLDRFLTAGFRHALDSSLKAFTQGGQTPPYVWAPGGLTAKRANGREFPIEATIAQVEVNGRKLYTLVVR